MGDAVLSSGKCELCPKESTSRCSWCRLVFYCTREHQKKDWRRHKPNCTKPKYKICTDDHLGRYLASTEPIKPDTILFKDKPLVFGPKIGVSAEVEDCSLIYCLGCYREFGEGTLSKEPECTKCSLPVCSPACSEQPFHRDLECRFFQEGAAAGALVPVGTEDGSKVHLVNTVTVLQSLLYFRCLLLKGYFPKDWADLLTLQSNSESREDMSSLEKTTRIFQAFKKTFESLGKAAWLRKPELHQVIGIVGTNGVDFKVTGKFELVGLFPTYALLQHSCSPNTKVYFVPKGSGVELYVRTAVRVGAEAQLSTSYTNLLWNTEKRREDLKKSRFFWCECPRCLDPYELGSNFSTVLCQAPDCRSFAVPIPKGPGTGESLGLVWQCTRSECGKSCEAWQVKKVDGRLAELVAKSKPSVEKYRELLAQIEGLVHVDYYLNFVINHSLIQMFGQDPGTRNNKEVLDEKVKLCNRLLATIRILDPGLGRLHVYAAVVFYEMQSAVLAMAGGEGDDDFGILRQNQESVKLAKVYLQKCINCFQYELFDLPENKLRVLAGKKMEYLNMILANCKK